jgi:hypothetical protein
MPDWYLEIYDAEGGLISSEEEQTYEQVLAATKECRLGGYGYVRFIGPLDATKEQLLALEELGARRNR